MLREGNLSKSKLGDVLQITARNVIFCFCGKYRARGGGTSGKLGDLSQITARNWKPFLTGNPTRTKISFRSNPIFSEDELFIFVISSAAKAFFNFEFSNNYFRPPPLAHCFYKYGPHHQYPCHRCCRHHSRIYPTGIELVGQRGDAEVHLIRRSKKTELNRCQFISDRNYTHQTFVL